MNFKVSLRGQRASVCLACAFALVLASPGAFAQPSATPAPDASGTTPPPGSTPNGTTAPSEAPPPAPAANAPNDATAPAGAPAPADTSGEVSSGSGLFEASQSGEASASGASEAPASTGAEFNGYVRGDLFAGETRYRQHAEMKAAYSEAALRLTLKKEKFGDAFAEARLRYGLQGDTSGLIVDLREAYVNLYAGPLDLRLGKQIVVWGRADALNPTSNLTPVDFRVHSPQEDDRRVGNVGARAFLNFQPLRLEGVWMPLYEPTQLPPLPLPPRVVVGDPTYPVPHLQNGTEGGRIHLEFPAVEMSASYVYGYAPLPGLLHGTITNLGNAAAQAEITRVAYNQHVVGFDFATTLFDWLGLRGEAAYRDPLHFRDRVYAPNPDVQYVVGVDHTFGEVSVIAQYLGRYVINYQKYLEGNADTEQLVLQNAARVDQAEAQIDGVLRAKNQILFSQLHQVQNMASLRVEWLTMHQTLTASALAFVNFSTQEWLLFPKIAYALSDNMTATVGAEIYEGPSDTLFGVIRSELSAGYGELRMAF
ncbi:MAG TPA: DUF1302 family protein [Polyangiaceae bacterium]|nr:DUF1302 family protein [Polyangiaceae bacterium]